MRARYYDPQLGRFLSEAPIGISGGLNLYAYAGNDPVNAADPSGMAATTHIIVWGSGTDWCSTQWGCAPSGTTCAASTADGTGARWCYEDDQGAPGLPLPGMPSGGSGVPGLEGRGGPGSTDGAPSGDTGGPSPAPSCWRLAGSVALNGILDFGIPGAREVIGGARLIARADRISVAGRDAFKFANALLREGNSASAAIHEGNGIFQSLRGGALGAERLAGEVKVGSGLAGWAFSTSLASDLIDVIPGVGTAKAGLRFVKQCM